MSGRVPKSNGERALEGDQGDGYGHGEGVKLNTEEDRTGGWRTVFVGG